LVDVLDKPGVTELAEMCGRTRLGWQFRNLKIVNKAAQVVRYAPNAAQHYVDHLCYQQIKRGIPVRMIDLKARQRGISTAIEARFFERVNRRPNVHAVVASADTVSTDKVFAMFRRFQLEVPADVRRQTKRSNKKEIEYAHPHSSSMLCQTAGKDVLGRGGTTQYVHGTEVAFWPDAATQLLGLLQEVPKLPETEVHIESTANGVGGAFHDRYWEAVEQRKRYPDDWSGYTPLFLPWYTHDEYLLTPPDHLLDGHGRLALIPDEPYCEVECRDTLAAGGVNLSDAQLYWRRVTIRDECGADLRTFWQEYPSTDREAFVATGYNIFSQAVLDRHERNCRDPIAQVVFVRRDSTIKPQSVATGMDCWKIWRWPHKNHEYIVYGDVCEGLFADTAKGGSDPDYHYAGVFDRRNHELVGTFCGRCDTSIYGVQMALAGRFYHDAIASPEINSCGLAVLNELKRDNYPNIYQRQTGEEEYAEEDTSRLGYRTTVLNRKSGLEFLRTTLNADAITIFDRTIIDELRTFINDNGKWQARSGYHDDGVMMLKGLLQVHITSGDDDGAEIEKMKQRCDGFMAASVAGGTDQFEDLDEDEDEDEEGMGL
jgi:hypothetical protein